MQSSYDSETKGINLYHLLRTSDEKPAIENSRFRGKRGLEVKASLMESREQQIEKQNNLIFRANAAHFLNQNENGREVK